MDQKDKVGTFRVMSSFTIRRKKEFYLIGELLEGSLKVDYYINVILNTTLAVSAKISSIEEIEIENDSKIYQLIIIESEDDELNDILFSLNVGNENIDITLNGKD
ncbi:hypothetical protein MKJ01_00955 [Chryseobacterium sp. SSA4.19]|uniref:hypothetical protein n=1 Tax=Chryseobacterium sp. SSA4.19 TaxID=2919915 RepID=UPI001F4EF532|nr:hypothetical protein [Chryseobacterium sp. SSA4.19]MCJ8152325.1 hypothetical protein [Chryseobacterium sp. SSA4.19]